MDVENECVCMQKGTNKKEVKKTIDKCKCGKIATMDGITEKMLKFGGEIVVK